MKRSIRFYLYFTVIAIFCSEGFALDPTKSLLQYGRDVWQAKDGFTPFAIHALHQTRDGYLWIGTDEGLVRFDGTQFTTFNKANTKELLVNAIVSLSEDDEGQLWMGTLGSGVLKYKNGIFTRFDTSTGLPTNNIFSIFVDSRNTVWAGMLNYGYAELQDGKWKSHTARADFQFNNVHYISENIKHELWFGFGNIGKKNKGSDTLQYYTIPKSGIIHTICFLDDGTPLFGHREEIYTLVNDSVRLFFNEEISLGGNIRCLLRDRRGNLWIASEGGGLFRYTNGVLTKLTKKDGLSSDRVISLLEDADGNLWIGTRGGGLYRLRDRSILTYSEAEGLSNDFVYSVFEDKHQMLWIGTRYAGVDVFKNGKFFRNYSVKDGLAGNQVRTICEDNNGNIWLGCDDGITCFLRDKAGNVISQKSYRSLSAPSTKKIVSNYRASLKDSKGNLWFAGYGGGLVKFTNGELNYFNLPKHETTSNNFIRVITEDKNGILWVGTQVGVNRLDDTTFTLYTMKDGLSHNEIFSLTVDEENALWIGTYSGGLNRLKNGKFISIQKKDGLYDDVVFSILDDGDGNFWMSCNKGIYKARKQELRDFCDGKIAGVTSISYGVSEGMLTAECNGGSMPSAYKLRDGRLVFPTVQGFVVVDPAFIPSKKTFPKTYVEQLGIEDSIIFSGDSYNLPLGKRRLEIQFTAIEFSTPERINFRYMLEGFDEIWNEVGSRRKAFYTNLPPGKFSFRLNASNTNGIWSSQISTVTIFVPSYFWETWWFRSFGIVLLIFMTYGFVRRREKKIHRQERQKLELQQQIIELESRALRAQMNPHFIFNSLNAIQECILTEKEDTACEYLTKFARLLRMILENSEKSFISLQREIEGLHLYLDLEMLRFEKELTYSIDVDEQLKASDIKIPPMLIQPFVENSFWHGLANKVGERIIQISVQKNENDLLCIVEDNGIGRERASSFVHPLKKGYESKGMRVTQERLEAMQNIGRENPPVRIIDLYDESNQPHGTRVEITIPITNGE